MVKVILGIALALGLSASALAQSAEECSVYTSASEPDGERVIVEQSYTDFILKDDGTKERFAIMGAGTGRTERVAFSLDYPEADGFQVVHDEKGLLLGPERFTPYCQ